jgi:hypothetical protein
MALKRLILVPAFNSILKPRCLRHVGHVGNRPILNALDRLIDASHPPLITKCKKLRIGCGFDREWSLCCRGGIIQTTLRLFVPFGLRALRSLQIASQLVEPHRWFSSSLWTPNAKSLAWCGGFDREWSVRRRGGIIQTVLGAVCPLRASRFALVADCFAISRTRSVVLIQPLDSKCKKPRLSEAFGFGAQRRNRTTDTRIFKWTHYQNNFNINRL